LRNHARERCIVHLAGALRSGDALEASRLHVDEMAHERKRRSTFVYLHDEDVVALLAAEHSGRSSRTRERRRDCRAPARVVEPEFDVGAIIQSNEHLQQKHDNFMRARVTRVGRNSAWVVCEDEDEPRIASLRRKSENMSAMLAPGDLVDVRLLEDGGVVVERVHPREYTLERRTIRGRRKTMAANIDTIVVVAALADPPIRLSMIDQIVAFAEMQSRKTIVGLTKLDLGERPVANAIVETYERIGYPALALHPKRGEGIERLRAALHGRQALLVGQSGVGKSSIFRALGGSGEVGEVSRHGRGRQTTTAARLYRMSDGFLIDSPGVGAFELGDVPPDELMEAFVEFPPFARTCRFRDCAHLTEPGCAVRQAAKDGAIASSRYESYKLILARADPLSAYA
jgi:ribosome biogenesis GTPase